MQRRRFMTRALPLAATATLIASAHAQAQTAQPCVPARGADVVDIKKDPEIAFAEHCRTALGAG